MPLSKQQRVLHSTYYIHTRMKPHEVASSTGREACIQRPCICLPAQILLRYELAPSATNSITVQNVNLEGTSVHVCLALSAIHLQLRYTSTVYGCLCQQTKLHGSLQSAFQIHPVSNASDQRNDLKVICGCILCAQQLVRLCCTRPCAIMLAM